MSEGPRWEVFVRARGALSHVHAGSVHAADAELALHNARDVYTRRREGVSLWVVPAAEVLEVEVGPADGAENDADDWPEADDQPEDKAQDQLERARAAATAVVDPELPVVTLADLGILRGVEIAGDGAVEVVVTPTYTGCPATEVIREDVVAAVRAAGVPEVRVRTVLAPAWTTDWITEEGRRKLREHGVAPPRGAAARATGPVTVTLGVPCPACGSVRTRQTSRFGSTACMSQWLCDACAEPFAHVRDH